MPLHLVGRKFVGFERALARQAEAFTRAGGPEVRFEFLEVEDLYARMVAQQGCLRPDYDLMMVVTDWYPTLFAQGALVCLDSHLAESAPPDWPGGWTESMLGLQRHESLNPIPARHDEDHLHRPASVEKDGDRTRSRFQNCYGLPYHDGPEMLIFRRDLIESDVERERFSRQFGRDLVPPRTWQEFLETAQFFTRPEEGLHGTILAAFPDAHNILYDFFLHLWSRGGEVLDAQGRPAFDSPIGIEALTFLRDLMHRYRVTPPDCREIDSVKSGERFASGSVALMVNWMGFAAFADSHPSSRVRGRVGCAVVPRGDGPGGLPCSLNIYWCLSIPAGSRQPYEACRFLRWVARPDMDLITSEEGAIGVRRSTWSEFGRRGVAGYTELERLHAVARHLPRTAAFGPWSEMLNEHLDRVLNRGADPAAELRAAARRSMTKG